MKLRTRLLTTFLACGLIPLVIFGFVNYVTANRSMNRIQRHAVADVRAKSGEKLIALRDIKKSQIEDYFNTIKDQMLTFSEDVAIIDAMKAFQGAFAEYREELRIDSEKIDDLRTDLFADGFLFRLGQSTSEERDPASFLEAKWLRDQHDRAESRRVVEFS